MLQNESIKKEISNMELDIYDILDKEEIKNILKPLLNKIYHETDVNKINEYSLDSKIEENQETIKNILINEAKAKLKKTQELKIKSINTQIDNMKLDKLSKEQRDNILEPLLNKIKNETDVDKINKYSLDFELEDMESKSKYTIKQELKKEQYRIMAEEEEAKKRKQEEEKELAKKEAAEAARKEAEARRQEEEKELERKNEITRQKARKAAEARRILEEQTSILKQKLQGFLTYLRELNDKVNQRWLVLTWDLQNNKLLRNYFYKINDQITIIQNFNNRLIKYNLTDFTDGEIEEVNKSINETNNVIKRAEKIIKLNNTQLEIIFKIPPKFDLNSILDLDLDKIKLLCELKITERNRLLNLKKDQINKLELELELELLEKSRTVKELEKKYPKSLKV